MYNANQSRRGIYQHHLDTYGKPAEFGYKDFIPMFKAEKFDAAEWAQLLKDAGAKYVIPVAEHHDGFPMYDSAYTKWNVARMGPKRDIIAELSRTVRQQGLTFGLSSHRVENWWFYGEGRKIESDVTDERYRGLYGPARDRQESEEGTTPPDAAFLEDWLLRCSELVDKYQPQVIWFDWWIAQPPVRPYLKTFSSYYYTMSNDAEKRRREFGAQDFRFTRKGDTLYAIGLEWPGDGATITIRSPATGKGPARIGSVALLGNDNTLKTGRNATGLHVTLPAQRPCDHAYSLKIR